MSNAKRLYRELQQKKGANNWNKGDYAKIGKHHLYIHKLRQSVRALQSEG